MFDRSPAGDHLRERLSARSSVVGLLKHTSQFAETLRRPVPSPLEARRPILPFLIPPFRSYRFDPTIFDPTPIIPQPHLSGTASCRLCKGVRLELSRPACSVCVQDSSRLFETLRELHANCVCFKGRNKTFDDHNSLRTAPDGSVLWCARNRLGEVLARH